MGTTDREPNIFVLTVDSLRADAYAEFMGDLAGRVGGVDFSNAVATASDTGSSMPALAAGVYADRVARGSPNLKLGDTSDITTMAEALSASGYDCWLWSDNTIFGSARQFDRGFEGGRTGVPTWRKRAQEFIQQTGSDRLFDVSRWLYFNVFGTLTDLLPSEDTYYPTAETYHESVLQSLDEASGGQMHWIHYMDVHHPFEPPSDYLEGRSFNGDWSRSQLAELSSKTIINNRGSEATDADVEDIEQAYVACVEYLRDQLAAFLDTLTDRGHFVPGHDILAFTADHGEGFDRELHGMLGHTPTPSFWEDLVQVPLVISHPEWEPGEVDCQVSLIDLMPTVLDAAGVAVPDTVDGTAATRPDELCRDYAFLTGTGPYRTYHGVRSEAGWKLFSDRISETDSLEMTGMDEADDTERVLLTRVNGSRESVHFECEADDSGRPTVEPNSEQWTELYAKLTDEKGGVATRRFDATMTAETEEQLRELGYLDNIR